MEIILNAQDIENLIKENFDGINTIKLSKTIKAILDVDSSKFIKKSSVKPIAIGGPIIVPKTENSSTSKDKLSPEERLDFEKRKGLMGSGTRILV